MNIVYVASSFNEYNLNATQIKTKDANFHAWEFKPESTELVNGSRIAMFRKQAATYEIKLIIRGTETERAAILNALHSDFENDLRNLCAAKIIWGNWYCNCYIVASETVPHKDVEAWTENNITILIPSGYWQREEEENFAVPSAPVSDYLDYPYDYAYDYTPPASTTQTWTTDSSFESDFEMRIHGPCVNPRVIINGYPYVVYTSVPDGSTLVVNSKNHTVVMGDANLFDARNKSQSVFQKIPPGSLTVSWEGFAFDLILFEERSEPKW